MDQINKEHHDLSTGDAGASTSYPIECSALCENDYVLLKDRPCKIVEIIRGRTGKHGHPKLYVIGIDIFTGTKYEYVYSLKFNIMVPNISRKEYSLLDISDDGFVSLLDEDTNKIKEDVKLPTNDIGKQIKEKLNSDETIKVTVVKSMGEEHIVSYKLESN